MFFAFLLIVRVKGYHSSNLPESAFDLKYEKFPVFRCIYRLYFFVFDLFLFFFGRICVS